MRISKHYRIRENSIAHNVIEFLIIGIAFASLYAILCMVA